MNAALENIGELQLILERKQADLVWALRKREHIAIEKSADQIDEIQYASERDLAIRDLDRDSTLLREVKAALHRIQESGFGICIECERAISPKRLVAMPWASRCIQCQEVADRDWQERVDFGTETLADAA